MLDYIQAENLTRDFGHMFPGADAYLKAIEVNLPAARDIFHNARYGTEESKVAYRFLDDMESLMGLAAQFYRPTGVMAFWFSRELDPKVCAEVKLERVRDWEKNLHVLLHKYEIDHLPEDSFTPAGSYHRATGGEIDPMMFSPIARGEIEAPDIPPPQNLGERILLEVFKNIFDFVQQ